MSLITEYNNCENCTHKNVCQFKTDRKEVYQKMVGRLDNCCCPEIFEFTFKCKEYTYINNTHIKDIGTFI